MNREALFSDGTGNYVVPAEPDVNEKIWIRFRTAKGDAEGVRLISGQNSYDLRNEFSRGGFDYYGVEIQLYEEPFSYCFEVRSGEERCYYNNYGVADTNDHLYPFTIAPGFSTPAWAKGAVMYQIFVDRFCNGDPGNDVETGEYIYIGEPVQRVTDWNKYPEAMGVREFYGGDLQGVLNKLDYLEELGVEVIYFNPLFVSPSNHKYDIQDYDYIDPHYGVIAADGGTVLPPDAQDNAEASKYRRRTADLKNLEASNQLFIKLVAEMHRRGMKVILDGVFNHCGSFNKWLDRERVYEDQEGFEKGAYLSYQSPYREYFRFHRKEENAWPDNDSYDGWWGHNTLPKLNYEESVKLENYVLGVARKWVSEPYNADGWRLDVAADLGRSNEYNHVFWKKFRAAVKHANADALILAEHYGDPSSWLEGDEWDTVMNYDAFMEPVTWFLTGMEKHSDENRPELNGNADYFIHMMQHHMAKMLTPSLQTAMNELSNHDHSRFLTRTNRMVGRVAELGAAAAREYVNVAIMRIAVMMQMTWVGAPTIYYGDEAGVCGFTDPDNRRTYPWGDEDRELLAFHKEMIAIHKEYDLLRTGSLRILNGEEGILAYGRFDQEEQIIVVINKREELSQVTVPVWQCEVPPLSTMRRLMYSYEKGYTTEYEEYIVYQGELVVNMGSHSALVLKSI